MNSALRRHWLIRKRINQYLLNINHPENKYFLLTCPLLDGYKKLVDKVENYLQTYGEDGFSKAIEDCIKDGILVEYLKRKIKEIGVNFLAKPKIDPVRILL